MAFGPQDPADATATPVIAAAGVSTNDGEPAVETIAVEAAPAEQTVAQEFPPAVVVPEPAPRDGKGNPLLGEGLALAFAEPRTETAAAGIVAPTPVSADASQAPSPQPAVFVQPKPAPGKSLFETLFQRQPAPRTEAPRMQMASLGPSARETAPEPSILPGVRSTGELFGDIDEEHEAEEDAEGYQVAAVGSLGRMSPTGLRVQTEKVDVGCLKPQLVAIIRGAERHFHSTAIVTSGFRNPAHNKRAGGAKRSLHMMCMAADIQVEGVSKWDLAKYLRTVAGRGGVGTYCRTRSVHIDIGEIRDWHYPCRRVKKRHS